jgi:hypothetical protein
MILELAPTRPADQCRVLWAVSECSEQVLERARAARSFLWVPV